MVKTRYTKADPNNMAEVGPVGPDGKEIPMSLVYGQVEFWPPNFPNGTVN